MFPTETLLVRLLGQMLACLAEDSTGNSVRSIPRDPSPKSRAQDDGRYR